MSRLRKRLKKEVDETIYVYRNCSGFGLNKHLGVVNKIGIYGHVWGEFAGSGSQ
jgi:hypothetical protein